MKIDLIFYLICFDVKSKGRRQLFKQINVEFVELLNDRC